MAVQFRNRTKHTLSVNAASGPNAHQVKPGGVLKVPGDPKVVETDGAYVVGDGDTARAYPKKQWEHVKDDAPKAVTSTKEK